MKNRDTMKFANKFFFGAFAICILMVASCSNDSSDGLYDSIDRDKVKVLRPKSIDRDKVKVLRPKTESIDREKVKVLRKK